MNFSSIYIRLGLLFLGFALLVAISVGATLWSLETQNQDALLINLAGRQRMLIQQIQREVLQITLGDHNPDRSSLSLTVQTFDQTLNSLQFGGSAPYQPDRSVSLPGATSPEIQVRLLDLQKSWEVYAAAIEDILNSPSGSPAFVAAGETIQRLSPELTAQADAVVRQFEAQSYQKIVRLRWIQALFMAIVLILLGAGILITTRSITVPLRRLGQAAGRFGSGDLSAPVDVQGASEINLLSRVMETMRLELKGSRDQLVQSAELLEQRVAQRTNELEALNQVGSEIASRLELPQVLNSVVDKTSLLLGAEAVFLCLLDESGTQMLLQATQGPDGTISATRTSAQRLPASQVLESEMALSCGADDCRGTCQIIHPRYRVSHLVAPLKTGEHIIGALCVGSRRAGAFSPDAEVLLTRLANIAAIAIENARLYAQVERAASLEERQCIAAEIHDGLAQTLSYLQLIVGQISQDVESGQNTQALHKLDRIHEALDRAIEDTRRAIASLQEQGPLHEVLQDQMRLLVEEFSSSSPVPVNWISSPAAPVVLSHQDNDQVLHIVREALNNARQHSRATKISVCLEASGEAYAVIIQDNGLGFDPARIAQPDGRVHFGLKIMQARAARISGKLDIHSEPGAGTQVILTWSQAR